MRERLLTLICALGALFLFGTLFMSGNAFEPHKALPTSIERSDDGLMGARRWLRQEGVSTLSLRDRFGTLAQRRDLPPGGNLLIVTLPAATNFRNDESIALDHWIRNGNTLLVMAALLDRPGWAQYPFRLSSDLQLLTGFSSAPPPPPGPQPPGTAAPDKRSGRHAPRARQGPARTLQMMAPLDKPLRSTLTPKGAHPYLSGVAQLAGFSDYPPAEVNVSLPREGFALALAHERDSGADGLWVRPLGAGTIIVSGLGSAFTNRALGIADNARLLANLIDATVSPRAAVIFDDEHQGLSDSYDPRSFFADRRLYATLAVIGAVWLAWVLGGTQLQMPRVRAPVPREAELVRTTGLFLARVLRPAAAARRMFEQFLQRLRGSTAAPGGTGAPGLWHYLENHPRLARAEVAQLRRWYAAAYAGQRVPLADLHNLVRRIERQLAA